MNENQNENFRGFNLFNDIGDASLRNRNRAVVLSNLAVDYMSKKTKQVSPKGASLILGYFQNIPDEDKADVQERFKEGMLSRGFQLV
jgi:hypothetical protein